MAMSGMRLRSHAVFFCDHVAVGLRCGSSCTIDVTPLGDAVTLRTVVGVTAFAVWARCCFGTMLKAHHAEQSGDKSNAAAAEDFAASGEGVSMYSSAVAITFLMMVLAPCVVAVRVGRDEADTDLE